MRSNIFKFASIPTVMVAALAYFTFGDLITLESTHAQTGGRSAAADQRIDFSPRPHISIVIEEGAESPRILVGTIGSADSKGERPIGGKIEIPASLESDGRITFTISGGGKFESTEGPLTTLSPEAGKVYLPSIKAGRDGDEGLISVLAEGKPLITDLRVASLPAGGITKLKGFISETDPAVIAMGDKFAVIDEDLWKDRPAGSVSFTIESDGEKIEEAADGLCIRTPFGPGKVNYNGFSPWAVGKRYSYKPESSSALKKGSGSSDELDALYRYSWGCGTALKVPDSCTATVYNNGSIGSCCNAAAAALGHTLKWVNPSSHGFPRCPISPW